MEPSTLRVDEAALVQRNALLAAIVQSAHDAIVAIDAEGRVISWNHGAQLHFGYSESEMIGLPVARFIPPDRQREQESALARVLAGEMVASFRSVRTNHAGQDVPVSVSLSPILDDQGRIVAASSIVRPRPLRRRAAAPSAGQGALWSHLSPDAVEPEHRTILVVEDEALVGLGLAAMLENAGFDILGPVGGLAQAMALLDDHECALAILDVHLRSGETSAPLARRLKRDGIPFFVISGDFQQGPDAPFAEAPCLAKPVGARELVATVQELLA